MSEIFRLNNTVRRDPQIDRWFSDFADPHRLMVQSWFERMRGLGPDVREIFHDGCPVACVADAPFGYVNAFKAYASVGFFHGAMLLDPAGVLEGSGKHMRHVKLRPGNDVNLTALDALILVAYHDIKRWLA
jgi:hypothetical protein